MDIIEQPNDWGGSRRLTGGTLNTGLSPTPFPYTPNPAGTYTGPTPAGWNEVPWTDPYASQRIQIPQNIPSPQYQANPEYTGYSWAGGGGPVTQSEMAAKKAAAAAADPGGIAPNNWAQGLWEKSPTSPLGVLTGGGIPSPTPNPTPGGGNMPIDLSQFGLPVVNMGQFLNQGNLPTPSTGTYTGGGINVGAVNPGDNPLSMTTGDYTGNFSPEGNTGAYDVFGNAGKAYSDMMQKYQQQVPYYAQQGRETYLNTVGAGSRGSSNADRVLAKAIADSIAGGYGSASQTAAGYASNLANTASQYNTSKMQEEFASGRARGTGEQGTYNTRLGLAGDVLKGNVGAQNQQIQNLVDMFGTGAMQELLRGAIANYMATRNAENYGGPEGQQNLINQYLGG